MGDQPPRPGLNTSAPAFRPNANAAPFVPGQPYSFNPSQPPPPRPQMQQNAPPQPPPQQQQPAPAPPQPAPVINLTSKAPEETAAPTHAQEPTKPVEQKPPTEAAPKETPKENGAPTSSQKAEKEEEKGDWEDDADDQEDPEEISKQQEFRTKRAEEAKAKGPSKHHINVVFIGHVDAGKSTIGGQLMYLTGMVDKRTLEKYEREAKEKNRESWYLSWCMDTNQEERDKGKTVEVGRAFFETETRHFTILDAPGHKSFVPNMIGGASQADLAVLVISARKGEFETGFDRGGQTNEHALLARTIGVKRLIILVNKMDDPTVQWDKERYDDIQKRLTAYLKKIGFNPKTDLKFIPVSGLTGANLKEKSADCKWYSEETFIDYLDQMPPIRDVDALSAMPVRCVIIDKYSDMGTIVMGKIETGAIAKNDTLLLMPNRVMVKVDQLWTDDEETDYVRPGENIKVKLKNVEEDAIMPGFTLCSTDSPCKVGRVFDAQVHILDYKSLICPGYTCVLHIHAAVEEITIKHLLATLVKGEIAQKHPRYIKEGMAAIVRIESSELFCLDTFKEFEQMGRLMLRDEGKTIGIGKVLKVIE